MDSRSDDFVVLSGVSLVVRMVSVSRPNSPDSRNKGLAVTQFYLIQCLYMTLCLTSLGRASFHSELFAKILPDRRLGTHLILS